MADHTHIEWTDATWNPVTGCSVVSPGCTSCYAMTLAGGRLQRHPSRAGLTTPSKSGPVWNGQVRWNPQWLEEPLHWKAPRRIFVCAHGDLFHEAVPDAWIDQVFAVMALAPQHTFQVLTKRSHRMRAWFEEKWQPAPAHRIEGFGIEPIDVPAEKRGEDRRDQVHAAAEELGGRAGLMDPDNDALWDENDSAKAMQFGWPLPNVWLGVSVEDQVRADERIPDLLATPAAKRFISAEPLLGPVDLTRIHPCYGVVIDASTGRSSVGRVVSQRAALDWVIAGGESGRGARPMHPDWARSLRDQCAAAGVPFFFKQWGEWLPAIQDDDGVKLYCVPDDGGDDERLLDFSRRPVSHTFKGQSMWRVGKRAAGRLVDGVAHDAMPAHSPPSFSTAQTPEGTRA